VRSAFIVLRTAMRRKRWRDDVGVRCGPMSRQLIIYRLLTVTGGRDHLVCSQSLASTSDVCADVCMRVQYSCLDPLYRRKPFYGVHDLRPFPSIHQLHGVSGGQRRQDRIALLTRYGFAVSPVVSRKTSSFDTCVTSESLYLNHSSGAPGRFRA
jgi:hypothetical protein